MNDKTIIVAGCTRSGLTATMQILNEGGYPCFGEYPGFEGYEIGSIDFEKNKGKAIKLVDTHLQFPPKGDYYVIRLKRNLKEQAKSIIKFLNVFGQDVDSHLIPILIKGLEKDYKKIDSWVKNQKGYIEVNFEDLVTAPQEQIDRICKEFDITLEDKAKNAIFERNPLCHEEVLEILMQKCKKSYVEDICDTCKHKKIEKVSHPGGSSTNFVDKGICEFGFWEDDF